MRRVVVRRGAIDAISTVITNNQLLYCICTRRRGMVCDVAPRSRDAAGVVHYRECDPSLVGSSASDITRSTAF
jgi:hypothetical protein